MGALALSADYMLEGIRNHLFEYYYGIISRILAHYDEALNVRQ